MPEVWWCRSATERKQVAKQVVHCECGGFDKTEMWAISEQEPLYTALPHLFFLFLAAFFLLVSHFFCQGGLVLFLGHAGTNIFRVSLNANVTMPGR